MSKLILLLILGALAYFLFRKLTRSEGSGKSADPPSRAAERMVACASCGVHLPVSEAIESSGRYYCCEDHRRLGP